MMCARWLTIACTAFAFCVSSSALATQQTLEQFTLKNGLQVVVIPNHRVPAVNHMMWYRIGAGDDPEGKSGLAHYHEHIMFKGSPKFKAGEYTSLLDKNGGNHNAFTGADTTSYFVTIAKEKLPLVMEMEADRMRGLTASDASFATEKQVIIEERRQRTDNSPEALLDEQMNAALFRNHPYHFPVIGWMHEMEGLTKKDVLDFHARYYHPNNALLIISGDVTAAEIKPLAEKYYGTLPKAIIPPRLWKLEPPQIAARHLTLHHHNVKQAIFTRTYAAAPTQPDKLNEAIATFVMAHLLGGGKNSALYQSLVVNQKLATSMNVNYNLFARGPTRLSIEATPEKNVSLETLEKAIDVELKKFIANAGDEVSLARSKNLMKADAIYGREGLTGISNIMGWIMMVDLPPETYNQWTDLIDAVTLADIAVAARRVLMPESSVTGYLLPEESPP